MSGGLFVTGGSGFVGRRLLTRLAARTPVTALSRSAPAAETAGVTWVRGDLLQPAGWAEALRECGSVIHLAAATGRVPRGDYARVNVEGTRRLLAACRQQGIGKLLFVSSIAAGFETPLDYPYARSKALAEELVRQAGVPFRIVRPTIILGPEAPVLQGLRALARLPLLPLPGGGRVPVQPIWVDDLCDLLVELAAQEPYAGETLELGGPEVLSLAELLRRLGSAAGRRVRVLPLPTRPTLALAAAAGRLPGVSLGQLASFFCDGTAAAHPLHERRRGRLRSIGEMLELLS